MSPGRTPRVLKRSLTWAPSLWLLAANFPRGAVVIPVVLIAPPTVVLRGWFVAKFKQPPNIEMSLAARGGGRNLLLCLYSRYCPPQSFCVDAVEESGGLIQYYAPPVLFPTSEQPRGRGQAGFDDLSPLTRTVSPAPPPHRATGGGGLGFWTRSLGCCNSLSFFPLPAAAGPWGRAQPGAGPEPQQEARRHPRPDADPVAERARTSTRLPPLPGTPGMIFYVWGFSEVSFFSKI